MHPRTIAPVLACATGAGALGKQIAASQTLFQNVLAQPTAHHYLRVALAIKSALWSQIMVSIPNLVLKEVAEPPNIESPIPGSTERLSCTSAGDISAGWLTAHTEHGAGVRQRAVVVVVARTLVGESSVPVKQDLATGMVLGRSVETNVSAASSSDVPSKEARPAFGEAGASWQALPITMDTMSTAIYCQADKQET
ncbi:hypothetical protein NDU88_003578 [Pleurodeles waltl]|uniref:Uncharacterized protein n=1 Tax=Pleurodeles waltl TaxID=8319 RepID=A0AAV7W2T7_PLEWA|nr:hypothetical protein NDU88_003578 [Pleurodeles waltl]